MTKDEFVKYLFEHGFRATIEDGVVLVIFDHVPLPAEQKHILNLKERAGYTSSFGWQTRKQDKK